MGEVLKIMSNIPPICWIYENHKRQFESDYVQDFASTCSPFSASPGGIFPSILSTDTPLELPLEHKFRLADCVHILDRF